MSLQPLSYWLPGSFHSTKSVAWLLFAFLSLPFFETILCRDVVTPMVLLVILLIGQQCSGMKIIQGFAVEIFADVFTKVAK